MLYGRPLKFTRSLFIARVVPHIQMTRRLSVLTRLESIYYAGWVIRTDAIREERGRERARLLIKLSFTRVNYPDGMSGKLIAIVEALFVRPTRHLINVTVLLCNCRFFPLFLSNYIHIYTFLIFISLMLYIIRLLTYFLSILFCIRVKG